MNGNLAALLDGEAVLSVDRLIDGAEAVERRLRRKGLEPGHRVGFVAASDAATLFAFFGVLRSRITAVPIGPRLTAGEIDAIAARAAIDALISGNEVTLRHDPLPGLGDERWQAPALIVPTSGTTAEPKLVRLGFEQMDASTQAWESVLPPATGWLLSLSLAHVSGIGIVNRALRQAAPIVLPVPGESLAGSFERAAAHGIAISHISLVASQLRQLLDAEVAPPAPLRAVLLGGGPLPEALVAEGLAAGWPLFPGYGSTETASGVVVASPSDAAARPWSAGRPMPGVELRIESNEILVRGPMVFDGYEGDPELTKAALDPDGWFHSGDLGTLEEGGWLRVLGRRDEMIISGGENVAPAEVEAVLASHPQIADVAVLGRPDERWGQVPVALVVYRDGVGDRPSEADLRAFARERLASFKIPARFVAVDRIPRTPNGKPIRHRLPELLAPARSRPSLAARDSLTAPDGQSLAFRDLPGPPGSPAVLMLHATLSTSGQLMRLAGLLRSNARVVLTDRRGSGNSGMSSPAPVPIARHVTDAVAVLDALSVDRAVVFGHSFGAVVALELAARHPDRVASVVAYEPPYLALADARNQRRHHVLRSAMAAEYTAGNAGAAAQLFIRAVGGSAYWDGLTDTQRAFLEGSGWGALADDSLSEIDSADLAGIRCRVVLARGGDSDPFYLPILDGLAARISGARRVTLPGLTHIAPISNPEPLATLIRDELPARP